MMMVVVVASASIHLQANHCSNNEQTTTCDNRGARSMEDLNEKVTWQAIVPKCNFNCTATWGGPREVSEIGIESREGEKREKGGRGFDVCVGQSTLSMVSFYGGGG